MVSTGKTVSMKTMNPADIPSGLDGAATTGRGATRSASLRKRIVSFVFDQTRKHGRLIGGNRSLRKASGRATA